MNFRMKIATAFIALGCTAYSFAGEEQTGATNRPRVNIFSFEGKTMREATRELSREFKERICFEEVHLFPKSATRKQAEELRRKTNLGVSVTVTNATLEDILEARCGTDSLYLWERDKETNTINVYPKKDAPLDWKIEEVSFTNITIWSVFERDLLKLSAHDVNLDLQFGKHTWLDVKVFLNETNISARTALNKLSAQLEPIMRWEIWSRYVAPGRVDYAMCWYPTARR